MYKVLFNLTHFQTIQLSISTQFIRKNNSISRNTVYHRCTLVLFNPYIGAFHLLPLRVRRDRGEIAIKGYSAFPNDSPFLKPQHQIDCVISRTLVGRVLNFSKDAVVVFCNPSRLNKNPWENVAYFLIPTSSVVPWRFFVLVIWFVRWEADVRTTAVL